MAKKKENASKTDDQDKGKWLPIRHQIPTTLNTSFADHLFVQQEKTHFILSFWETLEPLRIEVGADELENLPQELREVSKIPARIDRKCVARIVVTPDLFQKITQAVSSSWKKYAEKYGQEGDDGAST